MSSVINTEKIEDGQILIEPVINNFGQTLLPAGAVLKAKHINLLKTWNIFSVCIKDDIEETEFMISDDLRMKALEIFSKRMQWKPRNQNEEELYELGILSTALSLMKK